VTRAGRPPFITRWDLDKTYLRTDFDTTKDLLRTAFEPADQKRSVPGAAELLAALGRTGARVHILSGSPRQMQARLEAKLRLDGVRWDELTLKPNLSNLLRLRLRALRDQLGYKLPALLEARTRDQGPSGLDSPLEVLVGDDAEADAFVYSLYGDLCAGEVSLRELEAILEAGAVYDDQAARALRAAAALLPGPAVTRILIHLDRQSPPSQFSGHGPRVVPFYNYLQAAVVLAEDGLIGVDAVAAVARVLAERHRFDAEALGRSYLDLLRRGHARLTLLPALEGLSQGGDGPPDPLLDGMRRTVTAGASAIRPVALPEAAPDYLDLARRHRGGKNRRKTRMVAARGHDGA